MSPHFRSGHEMVTMGSFIVVLTVVAIYCNEVHCNTFTTIANHRNTGYVERNNSHAIANGSSGGIFWKNLGLLRHKSTKMEESRNLTKSAIMSNETNNRKSRLLGSLAFLAGLSFGELATAASSTVKRIAKLPQAGTFALNLGSSKTSPYIAGYYGPYPLLPYPFLYHGPFGFVPVDPAKASTTSQNDLTPQVISLFDNRQPIDLAETNVEYVDEEKKSDNDKSAGNGEDGADHRVELRAEADRNAEEKTIIRGCKEGHKKQHSNGFKGSAREREDLQVYADNSRATDLYYRAKNMTATVMNQTVTENTTTTTTTNRPPNTTLNPMNGNHTTYPYYPYYGGYPQDISQVDLTTNSDAYHYQDHSQINYNLPYEQPAHFYPYNHHHNHHDKYHHDAYSNPHVNPYFSGSFQPDQINEYAGTDFNRVYPEYQSSYTSGFRPVK